MTRQIPLPPKATHGPCELTALLQVIPPGRRGAILQSAVSFRPTANPEECFAVGPIRAAFADYWEARYGRPVPAERLRALLKPPRADSDRHRMQQADAHAQCRRDQGRPRPTGGPSSSTVPRTRSPSRRIAQFGVDRPVNRVDRRIPCPCGGNGRLPLLGNVTVLLSVLLSQENPDVQTTRDRRWRTASRRITNPGKKSMNFGSKPSPAKRSSSRFGRALAVLSEKPHRKSAKQKPAASKQDVIESMSDTLKTSGPLQEAELKRIIADRLASAGKSRIGFALRFSEALGDRTFVCGNDGVVSIQTKIPSR